MLYKKKKSLWIVELIQRLESIILQSVLQIQVLAVIKYQIFTFLFYFICLPCSHLILHPEVQDVVQM